MSVETAKKRDLSSAYIIFPDSFCEVELKAVEVLREEVHRRSGFLLSDASEKNPEDRPVIFLMTEEKRLPLPETVEHLMESVDVPGPEGFRLVVCLEREGRILIVGSDARGLLYGIGRLLMKARWDKDFFAIDVPYAVSETPVKSLRGHQLGYRPKTNAYDAWSVEQFDQYIRELALFGANAIEILPPETDDESKNELMQEDPLKMMIKLSEVIDSYGLDVWIWYPNMEKNLEDQATRALALKKRAGIFQQLKRVDAVLIPGGDPGDVHPDVLFPFAAELGAVLAEYHPSAKIWLSPQNFRLTQDWVDSFLTHANREPAWLGGIASGPWEKYDVGELREKVSSRYPIRNYPDICHNYLCQYPVRDWDEAFVVTLGRESVNPRPEAFKYIHNRTSDVTIGSIGYSEGIYDDLNKFLWLGLEWNPETTARSIVQDYAHLFISQEAACEIADAFFDLEKNWKGPLLGNESVEWTFSKWGRLLDELPVSATAHYRFQMGWLRACCDYYVKLRLLYETEREERALEHLRHFGEIGIDRAVSGAVQILSENTESVTQQNLRRECNAIADRLFESIGAQLTVGKHHAQEIGRGAFLDSLDTPLTSAPWLLHHLNSIRTLPGEAEQIAALEKVLERYHGGKSDRYISFSSKIDYSRFVRCSSWEEDPGYYHTPYICTAAPLLYRQDCKETFPRDALSFLTSPVDTPITVTFDGLEPVDYRLKITYVKDIPGHWHKDITLTADKGHVIHKDYCVEGYYAEPEYIISKQAVKGRRLNLTWKTKDGQRGPNIASVALSRTYEQNVG